VIPAWAGEKVAYVDGAWCMMECTGSASSNATVFGARLAPLQNSLPERSLVSRFDKAIETSSVSRRRMYGAGRFIISTVITRLHSSYRVFTMCVRGAGGEHI
jgi:hypothetical protein